VIKVTQVLVTTSKGIIGQIEFFDDAQMAVRALSRYVKSMNAEHDAALYDSEGLVANAKHFLDDKDEYIENKSLIKEVSEETQKTTYIIGNPLHRLGFMVASPDDPLGYDDPVEALTDLGQMRQDHGRHLKLYRVVPVEGAVVERAHLETHIADCEVDDFDYSLVGEFVG
jgi:hypothetical protein